jgi:hypothetical protein
VIWRLSDRAEPAGAAIADRHYNRQTIGADQFVPPGRCVVLLGVDGPALWVTSWPLPEYVQHAWPGAWVNSLFRNENQPTWLSSDLIVEAVAVTRHRWPTPPDLGMVTFIDTRKTRRKRDPGRCYIKAGFVPVGYTRGGLRALQMRPEDMPAPLEPIGAQGVLL